MKMPWMKFFPGDWLKDPNVSKLTPLARGIWFDLICAMHEADRTGEIKGTIEQLARISRSSLKDFKKAIVEFTVTRNADVTVDNKIVTVVNRRMKRQYKDNSSNKLRQKRHREKNKSNAPITVQKSEVRSQKSENTTTVVVEAEEYDPFFEMFRRSAGKHISDEELKIEIGKFKNKYAGKHPNQCGALINTWIANIGKTPNPKDNINNFI